MRGFRPTIRGSISSTTLWFMPGSSGNGSSRTGFPACEPTGRASASVLKALREGDTLVIWRLDRLGRSLKELISLADDLKRKGVQLRSVTEGIDTTTIGGELLFHLFGAIAQFERNLIRERTRAGLASARAKIR